MGLFFFLHHIFYAPTASKGCITNLKTLFNQQMSWKGDNSWHYRLISLKHFTALGKTEHLLVSTFSYHLPASMRCQDKGTSSWLFTGLQALMVKADMEVGGGVLALVHGLGCK